ncbi:MAG: ComEA family DNA-binding protein [Planctomycetota bacterium]
MSDQGPFSHWVLRRADQATVAAIVLVSLIASVGWWIGRGGLSGRVVEIDRAEPQTALYQVDINRAEWPELAQLPGIGETLAKRIVESRKTEGPFLDHGDIDRVRGIGPRTLERLRPFLLPMPDAEAVANERHGADPGG